MGGCNNVWYSIRNKWDMNLDCLNDRWIDNEYSLKSLGKMVVEFCNAHNFTQLVNQVTRVQFNSVQNVTATSAIDHVYCNAKHRISPVRVLSFGGSDHDALIYTRLAKEPKPVTRTIRKRSYKNFDKESFILSVAQLDFTDVFCSIDVDEATELLTSKLVETLNVHAPWTLYQERKNFVPWVTTGTIGMMKERDALKALAKSLVGIDSLQQAEVWAQYKVLRNKINNRVKKEELLFKREKMNECQRDPAKIWRIAKNNMEWK